MGHVVNFQAHIIFLAQEFAGRINVAQSTYFIRTTIQNDLRFLSIFPKLFGEIRHFLIHVEIPVPDAYVGIIELIQHDVAVEIVIWIIAANSVFK